MKEYQVIKRSSEIKPIGYDGGSYKHFLKELDSADGGKGELIRAFATAEEAEKFAAEEVKNLSTPYLMSVCCGKVWNIEWLDIELHKVDVDDDEFLDYYAGGMINYPFMQRENGELFDPASLEDSDFAEIKRQILDSLNLESDEDSIRHYEDCDYLTVNIGRDGKTYVWYEDWNNSVAVEVVSGKELTGEEIKANFC
jgi:hypothetical protein